MRLTPIEIRQHRFNVRMRGFDAHEVQAFLDTVVEDFEEVVRENAQLRRDTERLARELDTYQGRERNIQETLTTAQGIVEELKRTAMKEAEVVVSEAKLRGEKLLLEAQNRRADLENEIVELGHLRNRLEVDLRRTLEGYQSLIEAYRSSREASDAGDTRPIAETRTAAKPSAPKPQAAPEPTVIAKPGPEPAARDGKSPPEPQLIREPKPEMLELGTRVRNAVGTAPPPPSPRGMGER